MRKSIKQIHKIYYFYKKIKITFILFFGTITDQQNIELLIV